MNVLSELAAATARVSERNGTSVVSLGRDGRGAGVVVADGRVLTNAHNLRDTTTTVTFADGRSTQGSLAGADLDGDLAVLDVDTAGATPIPWADDASTPPLGAPVFGLANPGGRGLRATFGTVSAVDVTFRGPRGRRVTGAFEHTAPLGRGSSGGPVVDGEGRLLGLNTSRVGDGFYLAVPADAALRQRVDALGRGEVPTRVSLGVGVAPTRVANRLRAAVGLPQRDGLLVQRVEEGSPAARVGIERGDLLVEVGGRPLIRADDLLEALEGLEADATLTLGVVRGVEERSVAVRFGEDAGPASSV